MRMLILSYKYNKPYSIFVPNFIIQGRVVPERSLTEKKVYTHTYTDTVREKTKIIYALYTLYTGGIIKIRLSGSVPLTDHFHCTLCQAGLCGSVGCVSDWKSGGHRFDPRRVWQHSRFIMKYFLQSFSPFCWFKDGSCQSLAKKCSQILDNHLED